MKKTKTKSGAVEYIRDTKEKEWKKLGKKKPKDLTDLQVKELVFALARKANIL